MLSYRTIESHTLELLKHLMSEPYLKDCRLVGGTALALQYGHRSSVDLDVFGVVPDNDAALHDILEDFGQVQGQMTSKYIKSFIIDGIKVDFVNYARYPWLDEPVVEDCLRLASPKDIAAMKTYAIQNRGSRKDFIDMYFLLQHFSLEEILGFYAKKYPNYSMFRTRMALTYFEDAEDKECPPMFIKVEWDEIKSFISQKVREVDWKKY